MSSSLIFADANSLFVLQSNDGSTLELLIGVYWEIKGKLKGSAFLLMLEIILPFIFSEKILVMFLLFLRRDLELTNMPLALWKDYLNSNLIC